MYWDEVQNALNRFREQRALKRLEEKKLSIEPARKNINTATDTSKENFFEPRKLKKVEGEEWIKDVDAAKVTGLTLAEVQGNATSISVGDTELAQLITADLNSEGKFESYRLMPRVVNVIVEKVQKELKKLYSGVAFTILQAMKQEGAKKFVDEPAPTNCYDADGYINCAFGTIHYSRIYYCTRLPVEIRQVERDCQKCAYAYKGEYTLTDSRNYKSNCDNCEKLNGYYEWAHNNVYNVLATMALTSAGLYPYINVLKIGFDEETKELIIPLTRERYVAVKLNYGGSNSNFGYENASQAKRILSHFNLQPNQTAKSVCNYAMPYVDNRFYGINGEIIVAEIIGRKEKVKPLPFEPST